MFHEKVTILPKTAETYISVSVHLACSECHMFDHETGKVRRRKKIISEFTGKSVRGCGKAHIVIDFLDAYRYFSVSLQKLSDSFSAEVKKGLIAADKHYHILYPYLERLGYLKYMDFSLAYCKGVFPYQLWMTDSADFLASRSLPPRERWTNAFWADNEIIDPESYEFAQRVWNSLAAFYRDRGIDMTMRHYARFYLQIDTLLLAQLLCSLSEYYREIYKRDLLSFVSLPSFANAIFLGGLEAKGQRIELPSSHEVSDFFRRGLIGGVVTLGDERIVEANRPDMPDYRADEALKVISYFDVNGKKWEYRIRLCLHQYNFFLNFQVYIRPR